jgi:deazaflavin-dependent oxidoreductase (nitroreductase family)
MAKQYRVNAFVRLNNAVISSMVRRGRKVGSFSLLTVRGRKSGKPIATPLAIFIQDQKRYLIASYGIVNWVRNLRAAGGEAALVRGRNSEKICAIELEKDTAALVLREALRSGPPGVPAVIFRVYRALMVLPYLDVTENSSLEEFEQEVLTHPVFLVQSASEQASEQAGEVLP